MKEGRFLYLFFINVIVGFEVLFIFIVLFLFFVYNKSFYIIYKKLIIILLY